MKDPRLAAAVVVGATALLAASACTAAGPVEQPPGPRSSTAEATPGPTAEFLAPLHVPTPPAGALGPDAAADPADGTGVLGPEDVTPPTPTAPPTLVVRPA